MHTASKEEGLPQSDGKVTRICCSVLVMQKILPMMSVLGVCGEVKGHVLVVQVNMGMVRGRGCEWGLAFCMGFAMPGYIIVPLDSTTFWYRLHQMSKSHLKIELYLCAVSRGTGAPAMQHYSLCMLSR